MTDTTKGASTAKTWQTPELVSLDCGLGNVNNTLFGNPPDAGTQSETSGAV